MPDEDYDGQFDRPPRRRETRGSGKRWLAACGCLGGILFLCCGGLSLSVWYLVKPSSFPEQTQDYADARKQFQTTLLVHEKAPQVFDQEKLHEGVREIDYKSGKLELKAWIGGPNGGAAAARGPLSSRRLRHRQRGLGPVCTVPRGRIHYDATDPPRRKRSRRQLQHVLRRGGRRARGGGSAGNSPGVDPNRIYVAGHSAGGTLAMLASMTSRQFRACASFSGAPDMPKFVMQNAGIAPFDTENEQELRMRSALAWPKSFKCPARLYYGDKEFDLRFCTAALAEKARAAGRDVEAIEVQGNHLSAVQPAMEQAVEFFQKN